MKCNERIFTDWVCGSLHNGTKKIMIYGRKQLSQNDNKEYDYVACLFPEGNINENYTFLFNQENIREVVFRGYENEEEQEFQKLLNQD